jgi:4-amino-4-deoxy-L-arabinose transferase-like glycosyltransferase
VWADVRGRAVPFAVVTLLLAACWLRGAGLPAVEGTMGRDEARLALAARGILAHGLPVLPDGFLYTRGLLPAYLEAAAFAVVGVSDWGARLQSLAFGSLLVLAVYRLGRLAGGVGPALAAATIIAFAQPLVLQSREAWLYSSFLFWLVMAVGWLVRDAPGDRIRAGLAAWAALFSHELAVLLVPIAALLDLGRWWVTRRRSGRAFRWYPTPRAVLAFWAMFLAGVGAVGMLALVLRAPTAGGTSVEFREYLRPAVEVLRLTTTLGILTGWARWLLPVAVLAVPLSRAGWRALLAGRGAAPSLLAVLVIVGFNAFGLVRRGESRYVLAALPFLAVAAATALDRAVPTLLAVFAGWRRPGRARHLVRVVALVLLVVLSVDLTRLSADAQSRNVPSTWAQALADRDPNDLIVSFAPSLTSHYLGRTDFWARPDDYAKYVWAGSTPPRDVHTGAIVIRDHRDVELVLVAQHPGRVAWVLLAGEPSAELTRPERDLALALVALAVETRRSPDGRLVLKLQL